MPSSSSPVITLIVDEPISRLDHFLHVRYPFISINHWRQALRNHEVKVDGRRALKGTSLAVGQKVVIPETLLDCLQPEKPATEAEPELEIIYQDEELLALNKPAGCHTHPLAAAETGTLANHLIAVFPELAGIGDFGPLQPGLLHRLDFATSGVVLVARSDSAWKRLREQFSRHLVVKEYMAQVQGLIENEIVIDKALTHATGDRRRMVVTPPAPVCRGIYPARTEISPVLYTAFHDSTLVRLVMVSGVMHQLRVHLADSGHPLFGDSLYGGRPFAVGESDFVKVNADVVFHLHCFQLTLADGRIISAPLPGWCGAGGKPN